MKKSMAALLACMAVSLAVSANAKTVTLKKDKFLDKCKGAWAGQMIGVCYGAPYEFQTNGKPKLDAIRPWTPDRVEGAIGQDDCYVEMTFLKAIEDYGLDVTFEEAGKAFAETQFPLWHANRVGRDNVRAGIMPPKSGHPDYNIHADDIDFQIEADLFGILCPGLPRSSNALCDVFGHVMNYGDGFYGGVFVAGMYCAAYFEDKNVEKVIRAGLDCIPKEAEYHKCISDVIQWYHETPDNWLAVWDKIENKWQDDIDCGRGNPFNIDAKLNGAYIIMGLLYGKGDLERTLEVSTRCGQDNDCNPSSAAGVLCCMKGYKKLSKEWTGGIPDMADTKFDHTEYSYNTLIPACQRVTEQVIVKNGGTVLKKKYKFERQSPKAPEQLEQWENQLEVLKHPLPQQEINRWNPAWKVIACGTDMEPGVRSEEFGKAKVLLIHPVDKETPAVLESEMKVPSGGNPTLTIEAASHPQGNYLFRVMINGNTVDETNVDTKGQWISIDIDLAPWAGNTITVRLENQATDWAFEAAYLGEVKIQ